MQTKICRVCGGGFEITKEDTEFYKQFKVPHPTLCPTCRLMRRMNFRNTRNLYIRKCDFSGKEMLSTYHEDHKFPVYHYSIWWSDKWDAIKFGRPIDFKKTFFKQFKELKDKTPHMSVHVIGGTLENSEYTNCTAYLKNCYMIFEADYDEDCYYSNRVYYSENIVDCLDIYKSKICYECRDCQNCYNLKYSNDCENCIDSLFLSNCKSCKNCIGCINLRHKQFCIFNKQYTEEEYEKLKTKYGIETLKNVETLRKETEKFFEKHPRKDLHEEHNENSLGDYLYNSENAYYCFDCKDLEDCRYCARVSMTVKNAMDLTAWGDKMELIYESAACGGNVYNLKFCTTCSTNSSDLEYCDQCIGCSNCFGCVSLNRKSYCILNKQYSREEYFDLKEKLISHMMKNKEYGEFFPIDISPFGYNESIATEYFPLTKQEATKQGFKWTERDKEPVIQTCEIPELINNVPDSIIDETLVCEKCGKNYRIVSQELKFYRQHKIPIPRRCTNCRHFDRLAARNPKVFLDHKCDKCGQKTKTTYPKETKCPIYCRECYEKYVV